MYQTQSLLQQKKKNPYKIQGASVYHRQVFFFFGICFAYIISKKNFYFSINLKLDLSQDGLEYDPEFFIKFFYLKTILCFSVSQSI